MNNYLKVGITVLVLVCLGFFIRATNWMGVLESIQKVGYNFLILLFITLVSAWLSVLAWRFCMPGEVGRVSNWKLFWIRQIGESFAILNPTSVIGGEAMKLYMLRNIGVDQRQALKSIVLSRAIAIISQVMMILIAGIWFLSVTTYDFTWPDNFWMWLCGTAIAIIGLFVLLKNPDFREHIKAFFHRLGLLKRYLKTRDFVAELWRELRTSFRENRWAMLASFLACWLHWIVGSLEFYYILLFLGVKTTVAKALIVDMGVIVFKSAGAFIPGQIGIEEYGNKFMLSMIGIAGGTIWISVSILRRARQLFWIALAFLMYFLFFNKKLDDI